MSRPYPREPRPKDSSEDDRIAPPSPINRFSLFRDSSSAERRLLAMAHDRTRQHAYQTSPTSPRYASLNSAARPDYFASAPSTRPLHNSYHPRRSISEMTDTLPAVPQWQPDEDVSKCPVCDQDFFIFFRKHHCRKCGRVVCGDCSRHRITLPHMYIVHPPWEEPATPSAGSGESVRVCNPCVPDPWTPASPSRTRASPTDNEPRSSVSHRYSMPVSPSSPQPESGHNHLHYPGHRAARHSVDLSRHSRRNSAQFFTNPLATFYQPQNAQAPSHPHPHRYSSATPDIPRRNHSLSQRSAQTANSSPQLIDTAPRPPRRVVKEEDECPVCGIELAPGEELREQHITSCIATRFGSLDPSRSTPVNPAEITATQPGSSLGTPPSNRARAQSYRSRGLYPYKATEKDCTDNDGQDQECPICFEEFQPGDALGRLECLCRFHHSCIREWWVRKGPGMCPVHASHE